MAFLAVRGASWPVRLVGNRSKSNLARLAGILSGRLDSCSQYLLESISPSRVPYFREKGMAGESPCLAAGNPA